MQVYHPASTLPRSYAPDVEHRNTTTPTVPIYRTSTRNDQKSTYPNTLSPAHALTRSSHQSHRHELHPFFSPTPSTPPTILTTTPISTTSTPPPRTRQFLTHLLPTDSTKIIAVTTRITLNKNIRVSQERKSQI